MMDDSRNSLAAPADEMAYVTFSPIVEDYLCWLYLMERDGNDASVTSLAEAFQVAPPTVTATVQRIERDGWTTKDARRRLQLTYHGRQAACFLLRRRIWIEWMLAHLLGAPWSRLHTEAHRMEHTFSEAMLRRVENAVGERHVSPYGNPFPGEEERVAGWVRLSEAARPAEGVLRRVHEDVLGRAEWLGFLEAHELTPGAPVKCLANDARRGFAVEAARAKAVWIQPALARGLFLSID